MNKTKNLKRTSSIFVTFGIDPKNLKKFTFKNGVFRDYFIELPLTLVILFFQKKSKVYFTFCIFAN